MKEKIYDDPYKMGLIEIVLYYMSLEPERLDKALKQFLSVRSIVVYLYKELVWRKEIKPIEELERGEKERLWNKVRSLNGSKKYKVNLVRCYYLIEVLRA